MDINTIINTIGYNCPTILIILTTLLLLLKKKYIFLNIYIIGSIINNILNYILKIIIKLPRPYIDEKKFNIEKKNNINNINKIYKKLGMPSGHIQGSLYSLIFIYFTLKNNTILVIYLFLVLVCMYQRINSNSHNLLQTIIGGIVGGIVGYITYDSAKMLLKGNCLNGKIDDNCCIK